MYTRFVTAALLLAASTAGAQILERRKPPPPFDQTHAAWDAVLKGFSKDGRVDYRRLKVLGDLKKVLAALESVKYDEEQAWTKPQRLAFWLNAYNVFVVKAVLDHYPIQPERKCEYPQGGAWGLDRWGCPSDSVARIPGMWTEKTYPAAGRLVSLDEIENDILADFGDLRVVFALSRGTPGCPSLRGEAYVPDRVLAQLDGDVARFAADPGCWRLDESGWKLEVSPLLKWYGDRFKAYDDGSWDEYPKAIRGPLGYLADLLPEPDYAQLKGRPADVEWLPYDWTLNDRTP